MAEAQGSLVRWFCVALIAAIFPLSSVAQEKAPVPKQKPLIFGFLPILSTGKLVKRFSPLVSYLGKEIGREIRIETAPDYREFLRRTNEEKRYDLVFTAPHFYYLAKRDAGYRGLVRVDRPLLKAIIVVPNGSDIRTVKDLAGRRLSTIDPLGLGTVLVRNHLRQAGLDPDRDVKLVAQPTHNASLLAAYKRNVNAASLMTLPYKRARSVITSSMQILSETEGTPHMPFAASPGLDSGMSRKIENVMLGLANTKEGKALLRKLGWPGFVKIRPGEYDSLREVVKQLDLSM